MFKMSDIVQVYTREDGEKQNLEMGWTQSILDCRPESETMEWLDSCSDNSDRPAIAKNTGLGA
jgi:hypothetical protein